MRRKRAIPTSDRPFCALVASGASNPPANPLLPRRPRWDAAGNGVFLLVVTEISRSIISHPVHTAPSSYKLQFHLAWWRPFSDVVLAGSKIACSGMGTPITQGFAS
jgi:hypothetical protein